MSRFVTLKKLLTKRGRPTSGEVRFSAKLAPDCPFYVVGDIHGCAELLAETLRRIDEDRRGQDVPIIFVGDYIDRGESSGKVLNLLMDVEMDGGVVALKGNHEDMLLLYLDDPYSGKEWLRHGGMQTLSSFGVAPEDPLTTARALRLALGAERVAWLEALSTCWRSGNVLVSHAGADPRKPVSQQSDRDLIWGRKSFYDTPRQDGIWVVHGHVKTKSVIECDGRLSIDTGSYATQNLSAVYVSEGQWRVV